MIVLDDIPFTWDEERFLALNRMPASSPQASKARELGRRASSLARPKAVYKVCYVEERTEETVVLEGIRFGSRVLSSNLSQVERVFPYVATCGRELDEAGSSGAPEGPGEAGSRGNDLLVRFWLETIKGMALGCALEHLGNHLIETYGLRPDGLSAMNPGAGDRTVWPIAQQKQLFRLFGDLEALVGVQLTAGLVMIPAKTVSGIFFPTEVRFESCQLCSRENCPLRRAPRRKIHSDEMNTADQ
jgi:hypothetical protein